MKHFKRHTQRVLVLFALVCGMAPLQAQQDAVLETDTVKAKQLSFVTQNGQFDGKEQMCLKVIIPYANFEMVDRSFNKHLKEFTKTKIEPVKGSYRVYPMNWPEICDTSSVYWGHFEDSPFGLVWLSAIQCKGDFIEPNDHTPWQKHQKMMSVFAYEAYIEGFEKIVAQQNSLVKARTKDVSRLEKEKSHSESAIQNNERHIETLETEITDYDAELEALNASISSERSKRISLTEKEEIKESKSREKQWNKTRDKARKAQEKKHNQIFNLNEEISASQQRLLELETEIPDAEMALTAEETELARLKSELAQIKGWAK